jgi:hypothetical protein
MTFIELQMSVGGMKVVDDGKTICLENRTLVECLNVAGDAQREGSFKRGDDILREVIALHPLTELPVDVLCPLTIRTLGVFGDYNIATVADLVQCKLSEVRDWYNFGKASRSYLSERLRAFGLNLADQRDYNWGRPPIKRKPTRLDRLLILPTFDLDQGYSQEHLLRALAAIADIYARRPLSLVPGSQYGLNMICNRTDLDSMRVRRLVRDLVAKRLVDEPTQNTFTISLSGQQLLKEAERQADMEVK